MKMNKTSNHKPKFAVAFAMLVLLALAGIDPAFAQGLDKVNQGVEKILDTLHMVSIGIVTIAVIWSGYGLAFQHKRVSDIMPVLGGGILIGAAAEIAAFLLQ